jgi:hypothetical protein
VEHGRVGAEGERARRGGGCFYRPDPAHEAVTALELELGRGDEENVRHGAILEAWFHLGGDSHPVHSQVTAAGCFIRVMEKAIANPPVYAAVPVHGGGTVLAAGICRADDLPRPDSPLGSGIAIATDARTDGSDVVAARPERELPGATLLRREQLGRDRVLRRA